MPGAAAVPILVSESGETVKRRKRRQRFSGSTPEVIFASAVRPTRSTRTDPSVPIRPLILTPAQRLSSHLRRDGCYTDTGQPWSQERPRIPTPAQRVSSHLGRDGCAAPRRGAPQTLGMAQRFSAIRMRSLNDPIASQLASLRTSAPRQPTSSASSSGFPTRAILIRTCFETKSIEAGSSAHHLSHIHARQTTNGGNALSRSFPARHNGIARQRNARNGFQPQSPCDTRHIDLTRGLASLK
jgi:hypothetical protein